MSVAVVVVSYNAREQLRACLASVAASSQESRVVVVDNASSDGSTDLVRQEFPSADLIESADNEGFARAVNRGVAACAEDYVLLLNSDAELATTCIEQLRLAVESEDHVAAAGPRISDPSGRLELSTGRTMTLANDLWFKSVETLGGPRAPLIGGSVRRHYASDREVESLTAACLLIRRTAFDEVGGMDERFFLYAEDVDLCRRLRAGGWRLRYIASAELSHVRGGSRDTDTVATSLIYRASQVAFYRKHNGAVANWVLRLSMWLRAACGAALGSRSGRALWQWLRAGMPSRGVTA